MDDVCRVLVVTSGECEEYPGSPCVVAVIAVADPDMAHRVKEGLLPGEMAHYLSLTPASDYLPCHERPI